MIFECMDYTLTEFLKGKSAEEFVLICLKIQDCLEEFHQIGFVHLDIKPDNIMVKNGEIKLFEFSLSKRYLDYDEVHLC